jgi:hypothetical protein
MDLTNTQQGSFIATGNPITLQIRSDLDWMIVEDQTVVLNQSANAYQWRWYRGMAAGTAFQQSISGGGNLTTAWQMTGGFTLVNSSINIPGPFVAISSSSNVTQPVFVTTNTQGMVNATATVPNTIVRVFNLASRQNLGGFDFEVGTVTPNTNFSMRYALANAPGVGGASATGGYRIIPYDPIYYPRRRTIVNIVTGTTTVVTTSVTHGYTVGQDIRFLVNSNFGMTQINGLSGSIIAVNLTNNTFTVDINSTGFTPFVWAGNAAFATTFPEAVPFGEDTGTALSYGVDILGDATYNTAYIGMLLGGGANNPGGAVGDTIYWLAGKSYSVTNN